jgi:superfamily II DNA/RNA helicase
MGKRGKRRQRSGQANDPSSIDKRQKVDESGTGSVQVSYHGQESKISIPPPLVLEDQETSNPEIQALWRYLAKDKEWKPTPIQSQLWSILLQKEKNVVGIAPTGSGKTIAYGVPTLLSQKSLLVLVPTRELCQQVSRVYTNLVNGLRQPQTKRYNVVSVYGGVDRRAQKEELSKAEGNVLILVATPGRLLDLLQDSSFPESLELGWIVLDEADQLSKDGDLGPQVDQILEQLQTPSTTLALVSATFPESAKAKFQEWVKNDFVLVEVDSHASSESSYAKIPSHLKQVLHVCSDHKKPRKLMITLQNIKKEQTGRNAPLGIIFFARIERLKYVGKLLEKDGFASVQLHSQLSTQQRAQNLMTFQSGKQPLLLATDVAARGIDIAAIQFVIQYDFPSNLQQYVHRCGRAGRSGNAGTIYSFFTRNLKLLAADMIGLLESTNAWVDPNLRGLVSHGDKPSNPKPKSKSEAKQKIPSPKGDMGAKVAAMENDNGEDEENEEVYPELAANRIVLKRASHVSDASSSEDEEDDLTANRIALKRASHVSDASSSGGEEDEIA